MNNVISNLCKTLNFFIPKEKHSMYVSTPLYTVSTCMDVINSHSSNVYYFVNQFINRMQKIKVKVYVEFYYDERMPEYQKLEKLAQMNNIEIVFVKHYRAYNGKLSSIYHRIKNLTTKYRTKLWLTETGDQGANGKLKSQKVVCLNYFISCKNDLIVDSSDRWNTIDVLFTSSLLHSQVISASTGVKMQNCVPLGMARNDSLCTMWEKEKILDDISSELGYRPKYIFVYAPTYRDYEDENTPNRELLGFAPDGLSSFLIENKIAFVHKLHNLQESKIVSFPEGTVKFRQCYNYSFYDLLSIADCLITDYSSVGFDFMLRDKPLIYNLYDWERYEKERGMSYEPYEEFCPGQIVQNCSQLLQAMDNIIQGNDPQKEKREFLKKIIFKYADFDSTSRIIDYVLSIL